MKKLLFILGLLISFMANGQLRYQNLGSTSLAYAGRAPGSFYSDSAFFLPRGLSIDIARLTRSGALFYNPADSSLYKWTGNQFLKVEGGGSGSPANLSASATATSLTITNSNGSGISTFPVANGSQAGVLNAFDWNRFDAKLAAVDLGITRTPTTATITNSGGTPTTIPLVDANAGLVSNAMKTVWDAKLSSISTQMSITGTGLPGSGLQLLNDLSSPGANMVYGTSAVGAKGWKPDPAGGGGSSELIQTTYAALDASSGLATNKVYWITDAGREGPFKVTGTVADQSTDNGGTRIVNAGLQALDRIYSGPIDIKWFGLVQDAVAAGGAYAYPTGTDQKVVLDKAFAAAASNQEVICDGCNNIFVNSRLAAFTGNKVVNIKINGTIYMGSGCDTLFQVKNASGDYEANKIWVERVIGQSGIPANGTTARAAGTSPVWTNLTGTILLTNNSNKGQYYFGRVWGVKTVVEVFGSGGAGSQENYYDGITWYDVANHILFRSGDGSSFCDKNKFGWGSVLRLSGGLAIHFDGGPGNTGADRSNKFDLLIEHIDSVLYSHADVTDPAFILTLEAGTSTGIYSLTPFVINNTFRSAYWGGAGIFEAKWFGTTSFGQGGWIDKEIWNSTYKVGDKHLINLDGSITTIKLNSTITNTNLATHATAFPTWKFTTQDGEIEKTISTTYTIASWDRWITATGTSYVVTFPVLTSQSQRIVTIKNTASGTITISGVTGITSIPSGQTVTYRNFQSGGWQSITNLSGTSGGGSATAGPFVSTPNPQGATDNGAGVISVTAADATNPGSLAVGDQIMPTGIKTFESIALQGSTFPQYIIRGRQNGVSFNDAVGTPNPTSTTMTAWNFGSGSSSKDIVFGFGKTSVNWAGFANNGTDMLFLGEKSTGGWEFRNTVGFSTMNINGGSLKAKLFGTSGNLVLQSGGTAVDGGFKLDVFGNVRFNNGLQLAPIYWAPVGSTYALSIDESGNVASQPFPAGGSGGSSIFTAGSGTGSPYYHNSGAVNIGINPAQSWAWTHWGASCSTCGPGSTQRAIWEFASTSVFVPTPRTHSLDYNGSNLRFTPGNGVPGIIVTTTNGQTISNGAVWDGANISLSRQGTASAANGDMVVADGTGASKTNKPFYELEYTQTTPQTASATTSAVDVVEGTPSMKPWTVGDVIEIKGSGRVTTPISGSNTLTLTFNVAGNSTILGRTMPNNIAGDIVEFYIRIVPTSSTAATYYWNVKMGSTDTRAPFSEVETSGINTAAPTFTLTGQWSSAIGTSFTTDQVVIEHKRKIQ